jgi:hypothetical protein
LSTAAPILFAGTLLGAPPAGVHAQTVGNFLSGMNG